MSYMVGFGPNFPRRIHHRGSSLPSLTSHPQAIGCDGGFQPFFYSANPNPNILTGAIVGGPNQNDGYPDQRSDYSHSEPATYINAAMVGPLSYFAGTLNQLSRHYGVLWAAVSCIYICYASSPQNGVDRLTEKSEICQLFPQFQVMFRASAVFKF